MSELLQIPEGGKRVVPHAKFVNNVPPGVSVEAFEIEDVLYHALVLPIIHCDIRTEDADLNLSDQEFRERILAPMLSNLGGFAQHKTRLVKA